MSRLAFAILALLASAAPAVAKVDIHVDLDRQRMTVVKNGERPIVWAISSGRDGFETPTGSFIVQRMDPDHFSDEYDQAPMPYAIFFSRGLAIHGTYQGGLGRPASHGCVRLSVDHARELYEWVEQFGASRIEITGVAPYMQAEAPEPRRRREKSRPRELYDDYSYEDYNALISGHRGARW
ncbi:MAG TPA: L,D-transpeptidase [Methylocystis sp.]|nr:L,D-transpeptidase [Methylocystis sp.]